MLRKHVFHKHAPSLFFRTRQIQGIHVIEAGEFIVRHVKGEEREILGGPAWIDFRIDGGRHPGKALGFLSQPNGHVGV